MSCIDTVCALCGAMVREKWGSPLGGTVATQVAYLNGSYAIVHPNAAGS